MASFTVLEGPILNHVLLQKKNNPNELVIVNSFSERGEAHSYALRLNAVPLRLSAEVKVNGVPGGGGQAPRTVPTRSKPPRKVVIEIAVMVTAPGSLKLARVIFNAARVRCMDKDWFTTAEVADASQIARISDKQVRSYLMKNLKPYFKRRNVKGVLEFCFRDLTLITAAVEFVDAAHLTQRDMFK